MESIPDTEVRHETTHCGVCRLGQIEYRKAVDLQKRLAEQRGRDQRGDLLLLLEHPPTYTLGLRGDDRNLLVPVNELQRRGVRLYRSDRGGDITYHGPGQLVGWPILKLPEKRSSPLRYLRSLESVLVNALSALGVEAHLERGLTGVWVGERKVAAIGVRVTAQRVTMHGFALNVNPDLRFFQSIVPCGIRHRGVTSLAEVCDADISMERVVGHVIEAFARRFRYRVHDDDEPRTLLNQPQARTQRP